MKYILLHVYEVVENGQLTPKSEVSFHDSQVQARRMYYMMLSEQDGKAKSSMCVLMTDSGIVMEREKFIY